MLVLVSALVGCGVGAVIAAGAKETDLGKKMDKNLSDAWDKVKDIKDSLPVNDIKKLLK